MSFNTLNHSFRNKNKNSNLQKNNPTLKKIIKFNELSNNNNKSKLFLKNRTIEESSNNHLLLKNNDNNNKNSGNNLEDNDDSFLNTNVISEKKKYGLIEIISIYNSIISKLDNLINNYNKISYKYIFSCLIKIKNFIYNIIDEKKFIVNISRNDYNNDISKIKKYKSKTNINNFKNDKIFYSRNKNNNIFKNERYKGTKDSNTSIQKNNELSESNIIQDNQSNNIRKIKYLRQKIANIENKFKIEELNYLFCIGEQHKKISEL